MCKFVRFVEISRSSTTNTYVGDAICRSEVEGALDNNFKFH